MWKQRGFKKAEIVDYKFTIKAFDMPADTYQDTRSLLIIDGKVNTIFGILKTLDEDNCGRVRLAETKYGFYETHSALKEEYQGHGFGAKMYMLIIGYALDRSIEVRSSTKPTIAAQRVWLSEAMNDKFIIKRGRKRFEVTGLK